MQLDASVPHSFVRYGDFFSYIIFILIQRFLSQFQQISSNWDKRPACHEDGLGWFFTQTRNLFIWFAFFSTLWSWTLSPASRSQPMTPMLQPTPQYLRNERFNAVALIYFFTSHEHGRASLVLEQIHRSVGQKKKTTAFGSRVLNCKKTIAWTKTELPSLSKWYCLHHAGTTRVHHRSTWRQAYWLPVTTTCFSVHEYDEMRPSEARNAYVWAFIRPYLETFRSLTAPDETCQDYSSVHFWQASIR